MHTWAESESGLRMHKSHERAKGMDTHCVMERATNPRGHMTNHTEQLHPARFLALIALVSLASLFLVVGAVNVVGWFL